MKYLFLAFGGLFIAMCIVAFFAIPRNKWKDPSEYEILDQVYLFV
jgi:hypothetical protein